MKKYFLSLTLGLVSTIGLAQEANLSTFIKQGLQNNYQIRIVSNQEQKAKNNVTLSNAGYAPKINLNAGYTGTLENSNTTPKDTGAVNKQRNNLTHALNAGVFAEWTVFDGFKIQTNYKRLKELRQHSATQTRMAIEDYVADLASEYYNYIQQQIRLRNLMHAVSLSKERLRIVQERYHIGSGSRLAVQQAQVDFNADNARWLKQHEMLRRSGIRLNQMMANANVDQRLKVRDTLIGVDTTLVKANLWAATLRTNARLMKAAVNRTLAELDFRSVKSRDYPYLKLNANYAYRQNRFDEGPNERRDSWGSNFGFTLGYKLFDGNRNRERSNARIDIANAELAKENLELSLKADLADLWQAYQNNLRLLHLERQNLITAEETHYIAHERYMLGDLSGIEMREAQQNLLAAQERILVAEYNTKLCEISLHQISGNIMKYAE